MNESHVRPISTHSAAAEPAQDDVGDPDNALAQVAADFKRVSDRTMERTERLVARLSEPPPAIAAGRR